MKYTLEERLDIGRRIYDGELDRYEAAKIYDICVYTARTYMRMYRIEHQLPARNKESNTKVLCESNDQLACLKDYESMNKAELIREIAKLKIAEARLKKGYFMKGDGAEKKYFPIDS